MRQDRRAADVALAAALGALPVIWFALLIAPWAAGGLPSILAHLPQAMQSPFRLRWSSASLPCVLVCLAVYGMAVALWYASRRNYRRGEEYGSAKWGNPAQIARHLADPNFRNNLLFTRRIRLGLDSRRHGLNLHVCCVGGSGAGKTRLYVLPNLLQANTSFVCTDPKGELVRYAGYLEKRGYAIRVFDLVHMDRSMGYNPFAYLRRDEDVQKLTTILFKATTPKGSQTSDPFWDTAAAMLLNALVFYLMYEAVEEEQNFEMVLEMLREGAVKEEDEEYLSPLDILFEQLAMRDPIISR